MIDYVLNLDTELFIYLNSLGIPLFDNFWILLSTKEANIFYYSTLLLFYFYSKTLKFKFLELFYLLILIALMITVTDQTANLFKDSFQRLRPCYNEMIKDSLRLVKDSCGGKYGFFSAHASNSFTLAVLFGLLYKNKFKYLIHISLFYACLISYSRIYLGVHFPLDIFFGAIFGIIIGILTFKFYKKNLYFFKFFNKS